MFSDADAKALHVRQANQAVHIGASPAAESYLKGGNIIAVAKETGAQAVHPGYGFLSENASFARACQEAGLTFVGPPVAAIEAMGSKSEAKAIMSKAGVPVVPGYFGDNQDNAFLAAEADKVSTVQC